MKILKSFLRGVYYFGVGFNATCHDVRDYISEKSSRAMVTGAVSLVLAAAIVTSTGCASRDASKAVPESESASVSEAADSSDAEPSSSEDAAAQGPVELLAGATRYQPIDVEQLRTMLKEKSEQYRKDAASRIPTAGNLDEWKKINSDVVAWIDIPDTNISYPVLYTQNTDYYTHRGYNKEQSKNGVIWFDQDTKFTEGGDVASTNGVIYGHNWTNCWNPIRKNDPQDIMFAQLAAYEYEDFGKSHPYVYLTTPTGQKKYQVFTAFYTTIDFKYYFAELPDPNPVNNAKLTMDEMITKAISLSKYDLGVTASSKDKIITLSTCTRVLGPSDNQRFVVMAKLVQ